MSYETWIAEKLLALGYNPDETFIPELSGQCVTISEEMEHAFTGIKVVGGFIEVSQDDIDDRYTETHPLYACHWIHHTWLVTEEGMVIDPTAKQCRVIVQYLPTGS